jgi:exopolysaccharide biosynthesis protein
VLAAGTEVRLLPRDEAPAEPEGDLVQAGPMLVRDGAVVFDAEADREGFTAGATQFDSDITDGRYPRAALGVSGEFLIALACDGRRSRVDAGLSLPELAALLVELGAESAINLDGGGSTTLVHRRHLLNRPYSTQDQPAPESRPIVSALVFEPGG